MSELDAKFEDGGEEPIRLEAQGAEDLQVISTLTQDAVAQTSDMSWLKRRRRFMMLLNRFRWEDHDRATQSGRPFERVQSLLVIDNVLTIKSADIDPADKDLVLNIIGLAFEPGEDCAGRLVVTFSGDGALALDVEALDVKLKDVSRPYQARAQSAPAHDLD